VISITHPSGQNNDIFINLDDLDKIDNRNKRMRAVKLFENAKDVIKSLSQEIAKKNRKILKIAYFGKSNWIYPILNELNEEMRKKYKNSDLKEWGLSISTKLDMLTLLIHNINNEASKIQKVLKENIKEVDECIAKNLSYILKDEKDVFLLLAYIESTIFEMKSIYDLLIKYVTHFCRALLGKDMKETKFLKECKKDGLDKNWGDFLDDVRNDLIHNYASWISFEKMDSNFDLTIEMPELQNIRFKKYKGKYLNRQSLNDLFRNFSKFLEVTKNFLIREIQNIA